MTDESAEFPDEADRDQQPDDAADTPGVGGADGADESDDGVDDLDEFEADIGGDDGIDAGDVIADELQQLAAQRDDYLAMAQRVQADFDNFRKQQAARTAAEVERATASLAESMLPVLDAAEAAYVGHPDEIGPLLNLVLSELKKQGLESIDLQGKPFDPNLADAVAHEPGDGGEAIVAEVLRSGYTWKGRTLRPAMVRTTD